MRQIDSSGPSAEEEGTGNAQRGATVRNVQSSKGKVKHGCLTPQREHYKQPHMHGLISMDLFKGLKLLDEI